MVSVLTETYRLVRLEEVYLEYAEDAGKFDHGRCCTFYLDGNRGIVEMCN